jgi:beta-phosphoglucomutase-like phosphatase (HAD superfamily)
MAEQSLLPGVAEYIAGAKRRNLKLGVASSSSQRWVAGYLHQHGLADCFDCVKCSDDVEVVKPDPALYLAALAALEVLPHEAVAFEDSLNGMRAAKGAGLYCVVVPNKLMTERPFDMADLRLDSLATMPLEEVLLRATRWATGQREYVLKPSTP